MTPTQIDMAEINHSNLRFADALLLTIRSAQAAANATGQPQQVFLLEGYYNFAGAIFFDKNKVDEIPVCLVKPEAGHENPPGICRLEQRRRLMGGF